MATKKVEIPTTDPLEELVEDFRANLSMSWDRSDAVRRHFEATGETPTVRNVLKALVSKENADSWYTVRSLATRKRYRISQVDGVSGITKPDGYAFAQSRTHDFIVPIPREELTAGWVIGTTAKVLDVFEVEGKKYTIYELLD